MDKYIFSILLFSSTLLSGCVGFESKGAFSFQKAYVSHIKDYGYKRVSDPHPVRAGKTSERFEVRSGDCYWSPYWDDCKNDRERIELIEKEPYSNVGSKNWYGWSIFVPNDFPNVWPTRTVLGQFHQKGDEIFDPPIMFKYYSDGYRIHVNQMSQSPPEDYLLIPEDDFRGQWHDILVHAKWTNTDGGFIKIWVNGILKVNRAGALTLYSKPIYFRYGIYRHSLSNYKTMSNVDNLPTQIVYYDEVRKGKSRADVDIRLK